MTSAEPPGLHRPFRHALLLGLLVSALGACAGPLDRAWRAWERDAPNRSAVLLEHHTRSAPQDDMSLRAAHLRLLLEHREREPEKMLAEGIRLLRAAPPEVPESDRLRLADDLLNLAATIEDADAWADIARSAPPALDLGRAPLLPGLIALLPDAPDRTAAALVPYLSSLPIDEQRAAITAIDLALYRAHGTLHRATTDRVVSSLHRRSNGLPDLAPVTRRHRLLARLERNRAVPTEHIVDALDALAASAPQLAREAELRGLHRAARALWTHHATDLASATERADALREAAASAYRQGDTVGARHLLDEAIVSTPPSANVVLRASETSAAHGDLAFAELVLDRARVGAACDTLVPLAMPRLRLRLARAEDERSLADLRQIAERCGAPSLLAEASLAFAELADPSLALGLLEEVLDANLADTRHLGAWLTGVGEEHPHATDRVRQVLEHLSFDDALTEAENLLPLAPQAVGPVRRALLHTRWSAQPLDWARTEALLEACLEQGCDLAARMAVLETHLEAARHTPEAALRASRWTLDREPAAPGRWLDSVETWLALPEADTLDPDARGTHTVLRVRAALQGGDLPEAVRRVTAAARRGERLPAPEASWLSGLPAEAVVVLLDRWSTEEDPCDAVRLIHGDALVATGRHLAAVATWSEAATVDAERVDTVLPKIRSRYPAVGLALLDLLPADVMDTPQRRGERLDLLLEATASASPERRGEWMGLARGEAIHLMQRGVRLRRDQAEALHGLGQVDLAAVSLRTAFQRSAPDTRGAGRPWALDAVAAADATDRLRSGLREAVSPPPSTAGESGRQREGEADTRSRAPTHDEAGVPPEHGAASGGTPHAGTDSARMVRAMLRPVQEALEPLSFGATLDPGEMRRTRALAVRAAELAERLERDDLAVEGWRLAAVASSPPEAAQHIDQALRALASVDDPAKAEGLLHRIVGTQPAPAGRWSHAARVLLEHDAPALALVAARQALAAPGPDPGTRTLLAQAHQRLGAPEQALVAWEDALGTVEDAHLEEALRALWGSASSMDRAAAARALERRAAWSPTPLTRNLACAGQRAMGSAGTACDPRALPPDPGLLLALEAPQAAAESWLALLEAVDEATALEHLRRHAETARSALHPDDWLRILDRYAALTSATPALLAERARARAAAGQAAEAVALLDRWPSRSGGVDLVGAQAVLWRLQAGHAVDDGQRDRAVAASSCEHALPGMLSRDPDGTLDWLGRALHPRCTPALRARLADGRPPDGRDDAPGENAAWATALGDALVVGRMDPAIALTVLDASPHPRPGASVERQVATTAAVLAHGLASPEAQLHLDALLSRAAGVADPAARVVVWLADAGAFAEARLVARAALETAPPHERDRLDALLDALDESERRSDGPCCARVGAPASDLGGLHGPRVPTGPCGRPPLVAPVGCRLSAVDRDADATSPAPHADPSPAALVARALAEDAFSGGTDLPKGPACVLATLAPEAIEAASAAFPGAFRLPFSSGDGGWALALLAEAGRDAEVSAAVARSRIVSGDTPAVLRLQRWEAARAGACARAHWFAWRAARADG